MTPRERFDQNIRLAYKVLSDFRRKRWRTITRWNLAKEDFESAALFGLWKACLGFKPEEFSNTFSSYACPSIWNTLSKELTDFLYIEDKYKRRKNWITSNWWIEELTKPVYNNSDLENEEEKEHLWKIVRRLNPLDQEVVKQWMEGKTLEDIGKNVRNVSYEAIRVQLERILDELGWYLSSHLDIGPERYVYERSGNVPQRVIWTTGVQDQWSNSYQENSIRVWEDMDE